MRARAEARPRSVYGARCQRRACLHPPPPLSCRAERSPRGARRSLLLSRRAGEHATPRVPLRVLAALASAARPTLARASRPAPFTSPRPCSCAGFAEESSKAPPPPPPHSLAALKRVRREEAEMARLMELGIEVRTDRCLLSQSLTPDGAQELYTIIYHNKFGVDVAAALSSTNIALAKSVFFPTGSLVFFVCKRLSRRKVPKSPQFIGSTKRQSCQSFEGFEKVAKLKNKLHLLENLAGRTSSALAAKFPPGNSSGVVIHDLFANESAQDNSWLARRFESETDLTLSLTGADMSARGVEAEKRGITTIILTAHISRLVCMLVFMVFC